MMEIKAFVKWSNFVKGITLFIVFVILIAEYYLVIKFMKSMDIILLFVIIMIPLILIYYILQTPISIMLTRDRILLKKIIGKIEIFYDHIQDIESYKPEITEIRVGGSGGFFGHTGSFNNPTIGFYKSYVGNFNQAFLIRTKEGKQYVFSCENNDSVINSLKERLN